MAPRLVIVPAYMAVFCALRSGLLAFGATSWCAVMRCRVVHKIHAPLSQLHCNACACHRVPPRTLGSLIHFQSVFTNYRRNHADLGYSRLVMMAEQCLQRPPIAQGFILMYTRGKSAVMSLRAAPQLACRPVLARRVPRLLGMAHEQAQKLSVAAKNHSIAVKVVSSVQKHSS